MAEEAEGVSLGFDKASERRDRLGDRWGADEVLVPDAGQARDGAREPASGIDERGEALADRDLADFVEGDPCRADLDDPVALRIEAGGLQVERYQALLRVPALLAAVRAVICEGSMAQLRAQDKEGRRTLGRDRSVRCGAWDLLGAPPFQGEGHGFESRPGGLPVPRLLPHYAVMTTLARAWPVPT